MGHDAQQFGSRPAEQGTRTRGGAAARLLTLDKTDLVAESIDALAESIANQPEEFKVGWSFKGTKYFISYDEALVPYRAWLLQFFDAVEGADRQTILTALQAARASFLVLAKP